MGALIPRLFGETEACVMRILDDFRRPLLAADLCGRQVGSLGGAAHLESFLDGSHESPSHTPPTQLFGSFAMQAIFTETGVCEDSVFGSSSRAVGASNASAAAERARQAQRRQERANAAEEALLFGLFGQHLEAWCQGAWSLCSACACRLDGCGQWITARRKA